MAPPLFLLTSDVAPVLNSLMSVLAMVRPVSGVPVRRIDEGAERDLLGGRRLSQEPHQPALAIIRLRCMTSGTIEPPPPPVRSAASKLSNVTYPDPT